MDTLQVYNNKVVQQQSTPYFEGIMAVDLPEVKKPGPLTYKGPKLSRKHWNQIKAFMNWGYKEFKSEVLVRLYFNPERGTWRVLPLPQHVKQGLFVSENDKSDRWDASLELVAHPWVAMGSVHHHCGASAFQSGTDHKDEIERPGIHITLGNLDGEFMTIHARAMKNGIMYDDVDLNQWLESTDTSHSDARFPEFWKEQCEEKKYTFNKNWNSSYSGVSSDYDWRTTPGSYDYPYNDPWDADDYEGYTLPPHTRQSKLDSEDSVLTEEDYRASYGFNSEGEIERQLSTTSPLILSEFPALVRNIQDIQEEMTTVFGDCLSARDTIAFADVYIDVVYKLMNWVEQRMPNEAGFSNSPWTEHSRIEEFVDLLGRALPVYMDLLEVAIALEEDNVLQQKGRK